jgi:peptidylprolyl isomerase
MRKVKNGDYVQVQYVGSLEDDTVFDSSEGRGPLEFKVGGGSIIQGFNDAVIDMRINEEKLVTLSPDQAYGPFRDDLQRDFPHEMLGDSHIEVGQELRFTSPRGPIVGKVLAIEEEKFRVDFNHPLAGKTLKFLIKVEGITDAPTQGCAPGCSCGS